MPITSSIDVTMRRFQGYADPRFPIGQWSRQEVVVGTGDGGDLTLNFVFHQPAAGINPNLYSLERFFAIDTSGSANVLGLRTINMDEPGGPDTGLWAVALEMVVTEGGYQALRPSDLSGLAGTFLGRTSNQAATASLTIELDNILGNRLTVGAGGYVWDTRSIMADGGPCRPIPSLYK